MAKLITSEIYSKLKNLGFESVVVPTFETVVEWFREEKQIYLAVLPFRSIEEEVENIAWYSSVVDDSTQDEIFCNEVDLGCIEGLFETYQEAQLDMVTRAIEILENRKVAVALNR